jgi:hypothetical protein
MRTNHHLYMLADPMQSPVAPDLNTTKPRDISIPCKKRLALNGQCDVLVIDSSASLVAKSLGDIAYSTLGSS